MRGCKGYALVTSASQTTGRSAFLNIAAMFVCSPEFNSDVLMWQCHYSLTDPLINPSETDRRGNNFGLLLRSIVLEIPLILGQQAAAKQ